MSNYTPKPGSWSLFRNSKKKEEQHPDYNGTAALQIGDQVVTIRLNGWKRKTKAGADFLGGSIKVENNAGGDAPGNGAADATDGEHKW